MTNIARTLVNEGSLEEASKLISDILELNPNYQPALTTLTKLNRLGSEGTHLRMNIAITGKFTKKKDIWTYLKI